MNNMDEMRAEILYFDTFKGGHKKTMKKSILINNNVSFFFWHPLHRF